MALREVPLTGAGTRSRFAALLAEADRADPEGAVSALLADAVDRMVPDEAAILRHLARRPRGSALVHVHGLTSTGIPAEPVLEHLSAAGRDAKVALPQLTSLYVTRLLRLGLVELGPEEPALEDDYRSLLAAPQALTAMAQARARGVTPRVLRHTVVLSELGGELLART